MKSWWPVFVSHPDDAVLLAMAAAGAEGEARVAAHVSTCQACSRRLDALSGALAGLREAATAEADLAFTDARLERQRAQVLRRLAQQGQPARVLAFPASRGFVETTHQVARRWVAAAAVIGLLVGMVAGMFIDGRPESLISARGVARPAGHTGGSLPDGPPADITGQPYTSDEALLVELDAAAVTPRFEALQALDALTPRLREAVESGR